jgi:hypothetical protein
MTKAELEGVYLRIVGALDQEFRERGWLPPALPQSPRAWCQPMDCGKHTPRKFLLYFEDADRGIAVFDDEEEARTAFEKANTAWNCYLFGALPLTRPDRERQ